MAWIERIDKRRQRNKTWQDSENPERFSLDATLAALHYESEIDSGIFDTNIDATPVRVISPQFDGWQITNSGWQYALGQDLANHGTQDGWVGFGGRKGQNWFKFRLARVGYLHWPTRAWDDIGGAPTYKRQNLTQQTNTIEFNTDGSTQPIASIANWADVWKTPVGGSLSANWVVSGDRLKEEITINQAGRDWIKTNRPPTTPLAETYFGFVFQLDWSDIPKVYRQGILQDIEGDFADDDQPIEMKDALDRLLAFMPIGDVRVPSSDPEIEEVRQPLRKRFYKDTDGNYYLLLGVRADILNGMSVGDLIFDPTVVDKQVAAGADDGIWYHYYGPPNPYFDNNNTVDYIGYGGGTQFESHHFARFLGVTISGTIDVAYLEYYFVTYRTGSPIWVLYATDQDNPTVIADHADGDGRVRTTESVTWTCTANRYWETTDSIVNIIQELVDSYTISNDAVQILAVDNVGTGANYVQIRNYEYAGNVYGAKLHIEYTAAEPEGQPVQIRTQGVPTGSGAKDRPGRWN